MNLAEYRDWVLYDAHIRKPAEKPMIDLSSAGPDQLGAMFG